MTLLELSCAYRESAAAIRLRLAALRAGVRACGDPERARALRVRIAALEPLLREARELAQLTEHYYDRGYFRNGKYTF
ncbi:MAG: hypothetical protein LKJ80_04715 [Oscillibacter sp.]|jgi:hypothetical protein|nr:hypothetical protein [Oscillibacter sp.]